MAYNVLKGNVQFINSNTGSIESMVDDHSNQTIGGVKTFSQIITASLGVSSSAFYGDGSGLSGLDVAVTTFDNATLNTVVVAKADNNISGAVGLTYDGAVLAVTGNISASLNVSGSAFYGSAVGLTSIPTNQFNGNISAADLNLGDSTDNSGGNLIVKLSSSGGLESTVNGLRTNPSLAVEKTSPVNADKFLLSDSAAGNAPKYLTYQNLAAGVTSGITTYPPNGNNGAVQIKNGSAFQGPNELSFDTSANTLTVTGQITASVHVCSSQVYATAFYGDGASLTNLPASQLSGAVSAANIDIGNGLFNDGGSVAVSASYGLTASANGLELTASNTSGLDVTAAIGGIVVSPSRTAAKASPIANDIIIIGDSADGNKAKNSTLTSVVTLVQNNGAAGSNTQVQFNSSNAFAGDNAFTFNAATNTLAVQEISSSGNISASFFYGDGSNLQNVGGQEGFNSYTADFTVPQESDIIGIVTTGSAITASLSAANTYGQGQRFIFKDVSGSCSGSNHIVISASAYGSGDRIDGQGVVKIQTGYGAITIASDGANSFYIIGTI